MQADLTGYDYANLAIWQAFLRDVDLHAVNFAYADISKTIFTETFPSIFCVALSPDGKLLAMGDYASEIHVWQLADRQKLFTCKGHIRPVWGLAFSPNGTRLYSSSDDETVRVWDATNGRLQQTLTGHTGMIRSLALSSDGTHLATPSYDQTVKIWRLEIGDSPNLPISLTAHTGYVRAAAFSPDNTLLATGGADKIIRIWRLETGDSGNLSISQSPISNLSAHDGGIWWPSLFPSPPTASLLSQRQYRPYHQTMGHDTISNLQKQKRPNLQSSLLEGHTNEVHALAF